MCKICPKEMLNICKVQKKVLDRAKKNKRHKFNKVQKTEKSKNFYLQNKKKVL